MVTTVVNIRFARYDVYIGRPSAFGNPFRGPFAIEGYREWLRGQPTLITQIRAELRGKILGCWCKPKPCHGDVIARVAEGAEP